MDVDYEDMLLNGFESVDLRRENTMLKRQLEEAENMLLQAQHRCSGIKGIAEERERADKYESLYRAVLARCEVLNRKVRELEND